MLIGIFSDAHGHVGAFERALEIFADHGVDDIVFLGDAVGYIPDTGVLERLMQSGLQVIKGNHEALLFSDSVSPAKDEVYRFAAIRQALTAAQAGYIERLPEHLRRTYGTCRCEFVHGSPQNHVFGYVYPDTPLVEDPSADAVFMGNTHIPFVRDAGSTRYVNVGSCGLPRDEDPRGSICIFDTETRTPEILRFSLKESALQLMNQYDSVHDSVRRYLQRYVDE